MNAKQRRQSAIIDQVFKSPVFETERLIVGNWDPDLDSLAWSIYGDPRVVRYLKGTPEPTVESTREMIKQLIRRNQLWPSHFGSWPTFLKTTRELIGANLMKFLPDADGQFTPDVEIGWHLGRDFWGRGYATEGAHAMVRIAFEQIGLKTLWAVTKTENLASQRVAKRIGMSHRGQTGRYYNQQLELFRLRVSESRYSGHL
ncbi:MAG: GNAT family N-acetyltransferase [Planctomycetota bacterium]